MTNLLIHLFRVAGRLYDLLECFEHVLYTSNEAKAEQKYYTIKILLTIAFKERAVRH